MKTYYLELKFACKTDGPDKLDKYGMIMTADDIKYKRYNKTYSMSTRVEAKNSLEAGAKAMIEMQRKGFTEGNYLYLIEIKSFHLS